MLLVFLYYYVFNTWLMLAFSVLGFVYFFIVLRGRIFNFYFCMLCKKTSCLKHFRLVPKLFFWVYKQHNTANHTHAIIKHFFVVEWFCSTLRREGREDPPSCVFACCCVSCQVLLWARFCFYIYSSGRRRNAAGKRLAIMCDEVQQTPATITCIPRACRPLAPSTG